MKRIFTAFMMMLCAACVASAANYLTFTAEEDSSSFGIVNAGNNPDVQYSLDGGETWNALAAGDTITLAHKGDKALLRGYNPEGFSKSRSQYSTFKMTGKVAASGSVMSLIDGTGLSTEIPNGYCFCRSFRACTSLTRAPELPATTLTAFCYDAMFLGCTSLTQVPTLPATTLANFCYDGMFAGCTSLTQTPELPVTTLASGCYYSMFSDCKSLTQAPALPATTLADSCYMYMFSGCTGLSEIHVSFDNWLDGNNSTAYWVRNVAPTGTFICPKALALEYGTDRIPEGWTVKYIDDTVAAEPNYLTFTAEEDGSTFGIVNVGNNPDAQYSLNGGETWNVLVEGDTIVLAHKGDKAYIRGYNEGGLGSDGRKNVHFVMTGAIVASGSVMSLIDGTGLSTEIPKENCFNSLFKGCASLTQAPELPATTLAKDCYEGMFSGCTNLTQAPALPAATLADFCYYEMFYGCTGLTQAPELPATTLTEDCYAYMFRGCTSLTQAPELPATTLADGCYWEMFSGCTSLTQAPELPATTLTEDCYAYMFRGCTSLTQAPALIATKLAGGCYCEMFSGCTSLTQAPALPATTLADACYSYMFSSCTSLTEAPALPATTLANNCYYSMFSGCTSLTKAPNLPAPELPAPVNKNFCYGSMFLNCTNLSEISVAFNVWDDNTSWWVKDVAPTGTFICPKDLPLEYGVSRIPEGWTVKYIEDMPNYLTFTAEEDGSTFGIMNEKNNPNVQYSLNGGETWNALAAGDTITLAHKGDKALLRGNNPEGFSRSRTQYSTFEMTGKVSASGSVMSLIDGVGKTLVVPASFCFHSLFEGCTSLTQAPELPATTLTENCYRAIFSGCTSLTQAPALPATTLAYSCYESMFSGCTSLTQAPKLPATTLAEACYFGMFSSCTSLTQAPELPATTLAYSCYKKMFSSCDLLRQAPELPATTLVSACYQYMFSGCTSLTQAPELPAPELIAHSNVEISCYFGMFSECTNLSEISVAFVKWKDSTDRWEDNTYRWVENVAPTGTFICPKALPLEYGESRIPEGWTVKYIEDMANYLTFTAEEDGSTFGIVNNGGNNPDIQYSLDGGETWTALAAGDTVTLAHKGDKALLRGDNSEGFSKMYDKYSSFTMTGKIAASGSVMSLIDGVGISTGVPGNYCFYKLFQGCTSLTQAPELPATTLAYGCYAHMFEGCTSLTQAPELPATTLTEHCYQYMFKGCTSLTQAPELPAMTLEGLCYEFMFQGCTSLTQAPELPATTLADHCYQYMFEGCTSLTQAPELPATTLSEWCYGYMFSGCTSLKQAPELPATTLVSACYQYMFSGCTSLTQAPELPAPELLANSHAKISCYFGMFSECTNLSEISVAFVKWKDSTDRWEDNTYRWVENVAPTGTFICPKALPLEYGVDRIPEGWTVKYIEDMPNYLTFTAEEDGSSFGIVNNGGNNPDVRYSLDGGETWTALAGGKMVTLAHKGDKALLKGNNPQGFSKDYDHYSAFKMIGKVAASGSVMSLIDETDLSTEIPNGYCFCRLFRNCTSLTQAPELPATTLASGCYYEMFSNCTSLTQAPELPTTTLANNCYYGMFSDCTSLTQAPELPATTLAEACYYSMFSRCTSLAQAPELPATALADYCYCFIFSGCTSLAQAPTLSSMVMVEGCYSYMFSGCTSLTQAPELPATTLPTVIECGCYQGMFSRCTSLTQAPELPATTLANFCYREMFSGCANLTQAPELPATELVFACYESMFSGCTSLTQAPALPATTLADFCYDAMFRGCTSLSQIRVSFDDWNDGLHTDRWVADVAPTGTFICPKTLALEYGEDRIPEGWTVKYIGEEGSGVSSALADDITVWTDGLTVYVCGVEGEVSLYDMSGRIVAVSNSADEERALCVPAKGAYVVRANGGSSVVLVR